jgi:hypothetical protein
MGGRATVEVGCPLLVCLPSSLVPSSLTPTSNAENAVALFPSPGVRQWANTGATKAREVQGPDDAAVSEHCKVIRGKLALSEFHRRRARNGARITLSKRQTPGDGSCGVSDSKSTMVFLQEAREFNSLKLGGKRLPKYIHQTWRWGPLQGSGLARQTKLNGATGKGKRW